MVAEQLNAAMNAHDIDAFIAGVRDSRLAWARLYVEPVDRTGGGIDSAVREMTGEA